MNNHRPTPIPIVLGGLFVLFAIASILLGEGNVLANLFDYLIVGACLLAIIAPKPAFVLFLISCAYVDLFKRLLVVSGRVNMDDLYSVLGFAPALFGAIILSLLVRGTLGNMTMTRHHWALFVVGCAVVIVNAGLSMLDRENTIGKVLQGTANGGLYGMFIFVVPMLYKDETDMLRLFRLLLWVYAPVGIYGVVQKIWGFQEFEIAYLLTGLSIEIKQLFTDRVRAFSTLSSPTTLGAISAVLVVIPGFLTLSRRPDGRRALALPLAVIFTLIFLAALAASTSRSGFILVLVMAVGMKAFRTRAATLIFYAYAIGGFSALLIGARFFQDRLDHVSRILLQKFEGPLSADSININTFSDRLQGFAGVLTNPEAYTLFGYGPTRGIDPTDPLYNHDLLSNILVRYGALPLAIVIITVIAFLIWTHSHIFTIRDAKRRRVAATMLALSMGLFAVSITSGNVLSIFPVNVFFWIGITAVILITHAEKRAAQTAVEEKPAPYPPAPALSAMARRRVAF